MTAFELAQRFVGEVREIPGKRHSPFIQWCLESCGFDAETPDEVPWCSGFVNRVVWLLRLPRTKSAAARSWLTVGQAIELADAIPGSDIVILKRGSGDQPGPEVLDAPGHVGFFAGLEEEENFVLVLGGNQSNSVTVARFDVGNVLGVRRLKEAV